MNSYAFAQLSELLVMVAFAVYAVAFVLWCIDAVNLRAARSDRKVVPAAAKRSRRGAEAKAAAAEGAAAEGTAAADDQGGSTSVAVLDRAEEEPSAPVASPPRQMASLALALTTVAFVAHAGALVLRSAATQRPPWGNMYEFALAGTALTILAFLILAWRRPALRVLGTVVVGPVFLFMMIAHTQWYVPADDLLPALQNSIWLFVHVAVAILGSGLFALGAAITVMQLLKARSEKRALAGIGEGGIMAALPSAKNLESLAFRVNAVGFVMWTFTLIAGAIWAQYAWGRFWNWDPKEVWTFIVWVVYAAYLHARTTRGFRGSKAAWFSLVGFACVVFNFTGVNLIFGGLHSYSGV